MTFTNWRDDGMNLQKMIETAPALNEANQLAVDLQNLGLIGLEASEFLETSKTPDAGWRESKLKALDEIAKPKAALEFQVVESVKKLVNAAFEKRN